MSLQVAFEKLQGWQEPDEVGRAGEAYQSIGWRRIINRMVGASERQAKVMRYEAMMNEIMEIR